MPCSSKLACEQGREAQRAVVVHVLGSVERSAQADLHRRGGVDQTLLRGAPEDRPVGDPGAEVGVPGVGVRVELEQRERTASRGGGAQQRQADRVVAAEAEHPPTVVHDRAGRLLDGGVTGLDVDRGRRGVAGVCDLRRRERGDRLGVVVGPQQQRRLADRGRAEARSGAEGGRAVEGGAQHRHVGAADGRERRQSREGPDAGEARHREGVHLADGALLRRALWRRHGGQLTGARVGR